MTDSTYNSVEAKASYGIGLQFGQQLLESELPWMQPEALIAGLRDTLNAVSPAVSVNDIHSALRQMHEKAEGMRQQQHQQRAISGEKYLTKYSQEENVTRTDSGLCYKVIQQGQGAVPDRQDKVRVHYTGKLIDGTVFDSSVKRGEPAEFPVNGVIQGWIEALTLMPVGSKWQLVIPHDLAYGDRGAGKDVPPCSTLIFDVELLAIV